MSQRRGGFDPYGVGTLNGSGNGVGQNPYSFHSGIQDRASGLVKFGIRWYNPTTGTWTQQDTLDAPLDPANGNRYVFAGGDPINGLDPNGADSAVGELILACSVVGGIGAIATSETGLGAIAGFAVGCLVGAYGVTLEHEDQEPQGRYIDGLDAAHAIYDFFFDD